MAFLPVCAADLAERGWEELDFLFITGDAYVDHPTFGAAILTRLLEDAGYRVGILAQPDPLQNRCLLVMGRPRYGVFVSSGVVDSMVNHYTAARKRRSEDRYSPGGRAGLRPDRAVIRYCNLVRAQFGDIPLVIGGIESSLRRFAHYDYWSDSVRHSILKDSQADILVYGMGELPILEIANLLAKQVPVEKITALRGTCVLRKLDQLPRKVSDFIRQAETEADSGAKPHDNTDAVIEDASNSDASVNPDRFPQTNEAVLLPDANAVMKDKRLYALAFQTQQTEQDPAEGRILIQRHQGRYVVQNPAVRPMTTAEMDRVYALPYERRAHPMYDAKGGVPALTEVRFSINSHRGCYGSCSFCAIAYHQGRIIQHRSEQSILREGEVLTNLPDFKGYIHDVGGPTANFYLPACEKQDGGAVCKNRLCLSPRPCPRLRIDHQAYLTILRKLRRIPGVKKVFVRSGIRFDAIMMDPEQSVLEEFCRHHISGQLKVAPEHTVDAVLRLMGKPDHQIYEQFAERYKAINERLGLKQYLVPYLISGHPGCTLEQAIALAEYIRDHRVIPEQVQDFYPTPGTVSTTMYYTGLDPRTMKPVHVPDEEEKAMQRALLQFSRPENRATVRKALQATGRLDLIGHHPQALLKPASDERRTTGGRPPETHPKSRRK